jgi:hypothetical protein
MPLFMVGRVLADGWNVGVVTPIYGERNLRVRLNLKTSVGSPKSAQSLGMPSKS